MLGFPGRRVLVGLLMLTGGLTGCIGSETIEPNAGDGAADAASFTPCEHPWPCTDGSAWPERLTAPEDHPRDPPVLPDGLSIEDGTVASSNASTVTYHYEDEVGDPALYVAEETGTVTSTSFDVPSGLYLDLAATLTLSGDDPAPPSDDAIATVRVLDAGGDVACEATSGFSPVGGVAVGGTRGATCQVGGVEPLEEPTQWTVEVEIEHDVDAVDRFSVDVDLQVEDPFVSFEMLEPENVKVESFDGTTLDGWIYRPDVPDGVEVPVVLWSLPYLGQTKAFGDDPEVRTGSAVPIDLLVERGFAVAAFSVRGTGLSEGCFEMFGPKEQKDQAELVEWLADRDWSNDRVAMMGLSYHGTTPWEAAIQAPDGLKTIVVAGMVSDLYTFYHTPQGATFTTGQVFQTYFNGLVSFAPPALGVASGGPPERATTQWAPVAPDRVCPEVAETMTSLWTDLPSDERNPAYWQERRLIDGFPNVETAVLLTHGFQDRWGSGHQQQELAAWQALPASTPKHQLEGQWKHQFPDENSYEPAWALDDWDQQLVDWLDFWLKGVGEVPDGVGTVDYQDGTGRWHTSEAWPPTEASDEVLHLAGDALSPTPGSEDRSFRSAPDPAGSEAAYQAVEGYPGPLCTRDDPPGAPPHGLLYATEALEEDVLVAGNPFAHLEVTSDQPGGLVTVALFDLGPGFACEGAIPENARPLTTGAADLRFHEGGYVGEDFPTGEATRVRVDLTNVAEVVPEGHRLGALVSYGDPSLRASQPYTPQITVGGASEFVLPVVDGTFGGDAPDGDYPPRPFVPTGDGS